MVTYILLLTTGTITFIESIRTPIPVIRHIFNLETCVSIVGAYFYGQFLEKMKGPFHWDEINQLRYLDWAITTPMMLIVLCAALAYNIRQKVPGAVLALLLLLNYLMLGMGYLGDIGWMDKPMAAFFSFLALFSMFGVLYQALIQPKYNRFNWMLYVLYLITWSLYGVVYFLDSKQMLFNVLDIFSKCLVGIGLWIYYAKILK
jgi:putative effector of murein hydrolase LrgA (UPF0299 family)